MAIKRIKVSNFKSFKQLDLQLGAFNVLIGANASGKSNFIQILKFLRDVVTGGLENAVSQQGGASYLRNMVIGASQDLCVEVALTEGFRRVFAVKESSSYLGAEALESTYRLVLSFRQRGCAFQVAEESLLERCHFVRLEAEKGKVRGRPVVQEREKLGDGVIEHSVVEGQVRTAVRLPAGASIRAEDVNLASGFWPPRKGSARAALLPGLLSTYETHPFTDIRIYDFDPKFPKKAVPITGKSELEEDGSNLALALRAIMRGKGQKKQFTNLVRDLLPFVQKVGVEEFADKSMLFKLGETFLRGKYLPASLVSDGTINITALVLALYFQKKPVVVIEEPERNVHPHLLSRLVTMMKEASQKRQIIVTTHNPGVVRHADLPSILLVSRDDEGFSRISRPSESAEVQTFLQNEIGIDELFAQSVLESLA